MFKFASLCVILFMGQHYAAGYLDHDYEYAQEADVWLRLHMIRSHWPNARRICQLEGGILASPSTTALTEAMLRLMSSHNTPEVFTGIYAIVSEGDYESLDGVRLSQIPLEWVHKIPYEYEYQDPCVVLEATSGKVNDVSCSRRYPYFCRKETAVMNATRVCQTTVSGYEFEPRTGSCYKFHRISETWYGAAKVCQAEGGHLVIINSDSESQVIQDIFKKYPNGIIVGAENNDTALIGVWKWGLSTGEWQTVQGQTLEEAGFAQWSDEPNNNSDAAAVNRSGLLVTINNMNDKYPFICEINP